MDSLIFTVDLISAVKQLNSDLEVANENSNEIHFRLKSGSYGVAVGLLTNLIVVSRFMRTTVGDKPGQINPLNRNFDPRVNSIQEIADYINELLDLENE